MLPPNDLILSVGRLVFCACPWDIHIIAPLFKKSKTKENSYFSVLSGGIYNCFYLRLATANHLGVQLTHWLKNGRFTPQSTPHTPLNPNFSFLPCFSTPPQIEKSLIKPHFVSVFIKTYLKNHQIHIKISFFLTVLPPEANSDSPSSSWSYPLFLLEKPYPIRGYIKTTQKNDPSF